MKQQPFSTNNAAIEQLPCVVGAPALRAEVER
jgi:hypothetical protein